MDPTIRNHITMTERLLLDAGITADMRVLDVGSGRGEVSFMLARLVGPRGAVVGLDWDARATAIARARARELGLENVEFVTGDLREPPIEHAFYDALVGRRVLMYQPDPAAALGPLVERLRPGGLAVFEEVDASMVPASSQPHPLHERVYGWMWQTVEREGATTTMGLELSGALEAAGLEVEGARAEAIVQTARNRHITAVIVRAMLPRIVAQGVASEAEVDIESLDARLAEELALTGAAFVGDMMFGVWARKTSA